MDRDELLWRLYGDNRSFAQFHENQRATVTALVAGGNVALIAAMVGADGLQMSDLPFAVMCVLIAILGLVISLKSTEKLRRHNKRAAEFLKHMSRDTDPAGASAIKAAVDLAHDKSHWFTSKFRQSTLWLSIHIMLLILSLFVTLSIACNFSFLAKDNAEKLSQAPKPAASKNQSTAPTKP